MSPPRGWDAPARIEQRLQDLATENHSVSRTVYRMNEWDGEVRMSDLESFIVNQNLVHYKALLREETDPDKRRILLRLIENEMGKLPASAKRIEITKSR